MRGRYLLIPIIGVVASHGVAWAHSAGATVAGNSGKVAGMTCGNCHAAGTAPMVAFTGPTTLAAGATAQYTFTVTGTAATVAGLDVAASSSMATLTPMSPAMQIAAGEIVHSAPTSLSAGKAVFTFSLTAPPTGGPLTLYGAGVAGNSGGDGHGAKTTLEIQVTGGVAADGGAPADLGADMTPGVGGGAALPPGGGMTGAAQGGYGCSVVDVSSHAGGLAGVLPLCVGLALLIRARRRSR